MTSTVNWFAANEANEVALYAEPSDLYEFIRVLESPATGEAMAMDGVKRETVRFFVLDKEFRY